MAKESWTWDWHINSQSVMGGQIPWKVANRQEINSIFHLIPKLVRSWKSTLSKWIFYKLWLNSKQSDYISATIRMDTRLTVDLDLVITTILNDLFTTSVHNPFSQFAGWWNVSVNKVTPKSNQIISSIADTDLGYHFWTATYILKSRFLNKTILFTCVHH